MAGSRRITVEFLGKDVSAGKTANSVEGKLRGAGKAAEDSGKRFGRASSGLGKLAGAFAGLAVVSKVTGFLKDSVSEAREAQKVGALTTQVIKTTGGAAKVTASQVGELAGAISAKSGIDDEAIQSGANLLLTFKNIKDEAGKGNDIFSQTTQIMTDMGAAMGKDPKAAAIGLGKALNDPIKGVTALSKVGVTFDEKQKALIKRLVETGDVAGAQKVILKELKSEFGGAAAASATSGEKAAVAWGNLKEQVGTQLLPVIDKLAKWFSNKAVPAVSKFFTEMKSGEGTGGKVAAVLEKVGGILKTVFGFLVDHKETVVTFVAVLGTLAVAFALVNAVMAINPISLVIIAIAGLVTGLIMAYKHSETFRKIVDGAFRGIAAAGKWMWESVLRPTFKFLINGFLALMGGIITGAAKAFGWVPGLGPKLKAAAASFGEFRKDVNRQLDGIKDRKVKVTGDFEQIRTQARSLDLLLNRVTRKRSVKVNLDSPGVFSPPPRASGGPVSAGQPYIVGEKRPELFVPDTNGRIIPRVPKSISAAGGVASGGGRGGDVHVHVQINGALDPNAVAKQVQAILLKYKRVNGGVALGLA